MIKYNLIKLKINQVSVLIEKSVDNKIDIVKMFVIHIDIHAYILYTL